MLTVEVEVIYLEYLLTIFTIQLYVYIVAALSIMMSVRPTISCPGHHLHYKRYQQETL